jgi:hypothetical protein
MTRERGEEETVQHEKAEGNKGEPNTTSSERNKADARALDLKKKKKEK